MAGVGSGTGGESAGVVDAAEGTAGGTTRASARIEAWSTRSLNLEWNGRRVSWSVTRDGGHLYVTGAGETVTVAVLPRFGAPDRGLAAGGFAAPMPGVIVEVRVEPGEQVAAGRTWW